MDGRSWYAAHFPESMFLCSQQNNKEYIENVIRGKDLAEKRNVLICGIVRNAEKILPYTLARIERLGSYFNSHFIYLFENDSNDNTLSILNKWSNEYHNSLVESDTFNPPPFTDPRGRIRKRYMAMARNKYLEFARAFTTEHKTNYVIIVDMDLLGGWSYHGVLNSLGYVYNWDMIGSNSICYINEKNGWKKLFYDSWAFRPLNHPEALEDADANLFIFNRGERLVEVNSCFGGLAIYKTHFLFEGLNYNEEDCDHPSLNNELVKLGYQMYLNPSQITLYNKNQYVI